MMAPRLGISPPLKSGKEDMRIVHTSDWHAGRVWKHIDRLPELVDVLENLGDFLERERIDLLLMSGDVFDSGAPKPATERLVFGFFKRIGRAGIKSVVIAGNHDSPARLEAWGTLAELVDVQTVAFPRRLDDGGLVEVEARSGERARVAAVPFAAPRRLVSALDLSADETQVRQKYDQGMRQIIAHLVGGFERETINLVMAHTHLQGAVFSGSERQVHLGEEWATTPQALPSSAHYIALGHIHRSQKVEAAPALLSTRALRCSSISARPVKKKLRLDRCPAATAGPHRANFVSRRTPAPIGSHGARRVGAEAARLSARGWLRVRVPLKVADPDVNSKVRRLIPNAVAVEIELPEKAEEKDPSRPPGGSPPRELYQAYFQKEHGSEAEQQVVETFDRLLAAADQGDKG